MKKSSKGFTLIELLVVIAIIGMLAAVVLASLNSARNKGADASIKSTINNSRAQAELFYDSNSNAYTNVCTGTGGIAQNKNSADSTNGAGTAVCTSDANEWRLYAALVATTGQYYCVDHKGNATTTTVIATINSTTDGDIDCD